MGRPSTSSVIEGSGLPPRMEDKRHMAKSSKPSCNTARLASRANRFNSRDRVGWEGRCCVNGVVLQLIAAGQLKHRIFTQQLGVAQIIPALSLLDHQCAQLTGQAVPHFGWVTMVLQLLSKLLTDTATFHDFPQQKSAAITAGFATTEAYRNRRVAGRFPGWYCFTHGERSPLIKFLSEHIDYKG